jgi:RNA 2',3'-cyclic 3'-phosphodiesterase
MRVFIAIELPDQIRSGLAELESDLKPVTNSARWVAPESIHVTLKFIGEIPEQRLPAIDSALVGLSWKPFTVTVRGIGFFPGNRSPRVFWAGLEAASMEGLAERIDVRMEQLGFEKEKRAFRPHLTLARAREMRIHGSLVAASEKYANHNFGSFTADRYNLFQSTLKPTGAVYNKLKEYLLEPRSV